MKIGIICFPTYGGSGAVATELGKELVKKGHKIHFIAEEVPFRLIGPWQRNIVLHTVERFDYPLFDKYPIYPLHLANKILELANQLKLDLIHAHYAIPNATSAVIARNALKNKLKVVTTLHGTDVSLIGDEPTLKEIAGYFIDQSDGITAVAKSLAKEAKEKYQLKKNIKVIYNFVRPITYPKNQTKEILEIFSPNGEKIITHISNFREVKRIQDVVEIFYRVSKKINAKMLLVGDGPDLRVAHRAANKWQILDKVHFLGTQTNINRLLAISDVFLLPSEKEGFSLSALEALSHGVPVITTKIGGMPEMIIDGETGFLAEVGDIKTMLEWVTQLLSDDKLRKKISSAAKARVRQNFTPEVIVPQYEEFYKKVLQR